MPALYVMDSISGFREATKPPDNAASFAATTGEILLAKALPAYVSESLCRMVAYKFNRNLPVSLPGVGDIIELYQSGEISSELLRDIGLALGSEFSRPHRGWRIYAREQEQLGFGKEQATEERTIWDQMLVHRHWSPDISTLLALFNRRLARPEVIDYWMRRLGVSDPAAQQVVRELSSYVPSPSEVIRYAVREVFNPEMVEKLGLRDEFPPHFRTWANYSGVRSITLPDPIVPGQTNTLDVPLAEWISHWVHASPTQSYQGLHRLRPDNIERVRADLRLRLDAEVEAGLSTQAEADDLVKGLRPITVSDVARLLKVNDYAPIWRPMLTAISYTPLTRVDIRRMLQVGELTPEELPGRYQDIGYSPSDSVRLANFAMRLRARSAQQAVIRRTKQQITGAYELGVIGETEARGQLVGHGLTESEANAALVSIRLELRVRYIKRAISVVRGRYRTGAIDDSEALTELRRLALDEARIKELVELWSLERTGRAREISAAKVLAMYREGVLATPEVTMRLGNLGYRTADIRLLLEQAEKKGANRAEPRRQRATAPAQTPEALPPPAMPGQ